MKDKFVVKFWYDVCVHTALKWAYTVVALFKYLQCPFYFDKQNYDKVLAKISSNL